MKRITLHTFRKMAAAEEIMLRGAMPRVSAGDPVGLRETFPVGSRTAVVVAARGATRLVRPLTATVAELGGVR